ncbi:uncharacterized protein LOC110093290 [Dendrobium catenatum]|uniref:uncharacterized protein LOC110093290 n=1 Tax=Dendrobium catenatum TaxID=906689 RepID=UPI0009F40784|nr:uncharacterized protein LOC110093290 [Dendrobium catenatum]
MASNHCLILLNLMDFKPINRKVLRFEEVWTTIPASIVVVKNSWEKKVSGDPSQAINQKLKRILRNLYYWSKAKFKSLNLSKVEPKSEVLRLQELETADGLILDQLQWELKIKLEELNSVMTRLDTWWKQRSKVKWIVEGDSNSKFFQAYASGRRNGNFIHKIRERVPFA